MTRAALYARYSDDRQNPRSIADQLQVLAATAEARGWSVTASYMDAAISGQSMANRPGLLNAISAAERGEYDILLVEDEDRLARDEEHQWHVYNRLGAAGVSISTMATVQVSRMQVAFKSFMAAEYIQVLSQKTKRGLASNAEKGLATGARLYGYRTAPGGLVEIVPEEADVVRRIFTLYADQDMTPRAIADLLNREHIPASRGGPWSASTITGSAARANGVLHSEIYAGVKVYGRVERKKDRQTGRRLSITRPSSEHQRVDVPHLTIIDRPLWDRAQARILSRRNVDPSQLVNLRRRPGLLTGLLKCGRCGGSYTSLSAGRLVCVNYREKGATACTNNRHVSRAMIEQRVLTGLRERLLSPEAVSAYVRAYHEAWRERAAENENRRAPLARRLGELDRAIDRGSDALLAGHTPAAVIGPKLAEMNRERIEIRQALAQVEADAPPPVRLHPKAAENYANRIADFQARLAQAGDSTDPAEREVVDSVRDLIARIDIEPVNAEPRAPVKVTLHGDLARFVRPNAPRVECGGKLVTGGGIEPPTCGL